jgi:hypothetical protein
VVHCRRAITVREHPETIMVNTLSRKDQMIHTSGFAAGRDMAFLVVSA